ncbi:hypothetical protein EKO27_g6542 [Xylaria grammica]|uniref:Ran-interacting Mog1 protein n=1 Tax=Xylaria grammica TaxID=363999 RepID=A0A439D2A7_9PEZI|nr:hypothetical protein EKO27_g6542 [Xylaria grammica]
MTTYQDTPLFGGALVCDLPKRFADVSRLREVPDNQEVYIDKEGFSSIIIEINERVGDEGSTPEIDGRALTTHLEEVVGEDIEGLKVWNTTPTQFSKLDSTPANPCASRAHSEDIPAYTLIATLSPHTSTEAESGAPQAKAAPDFTAIILTLVRLERERTDILITVNVPHIRGEYDEDDVDLELGKQGQLIGDAVDYASHIWETFKVRDWGLFKEV